MAKSEARKRIEDIVARVVLSKGIDMFPFLDSLPMVQRKLCLNAIGEYIDGIPPNVYLGMLMDPLEVGAAIAEDPGMRDWLAELAKGTRAGLTLADLASLSEAMEAYIGETSSEAEAEVKPRPAMTLVSDVSDAGDELRNAVAKHFGLPVEQVEVIRVNSE